MKNHPCEKFQNSSIQSEFEDSRICCQIRRNKMHFHVINRFQNDANYSHKVKKRKIFFTKFHQSSKKSKMWLNYFWTNGAQFRMIPFQKIKNFDFFFIQRQISFMLANRCQDYEQISSPSPQNFQEFADINVCKIVFLNFLSV